jgi:hypothetical protein
MKAAVLVEIEIRIFTIGFDKVSAVCSARFLDHSIKKSRLFDQTKIIYVVDCTSRNTIVLRNLTTQKKRERN